MKIELDQKYMKIIKYVTLCFLIIYLIYAIIANLNLVFNTVLNFITNTLKILSPLIWGIIIAYLLLPLVKIFEKNITYLFSNKKNKKRIEPEKNKLIRIVSITLAFLLVFIVIFIMMYSIFVMVSGGFKSFSWTETREYLNINVQKYADTIKNIQVGLQDIGMSNNILKILDSFSRDFSQGLQKFVTIFATKIGTISKYIIDISFGMVFAVNILYNKEYFEKLSENFLRLIFSEKRVKTIQELFSEINNVLISFIRGKILDLTFLSFVTAFSLMLIDFEFAFMVGLFAGYTNIVPYIGTWIGIIPAVIIALISGSLERAIIVGLYIVIVQQIYIMLVSPKVQGKSIGIHPFFILLSLIVFGAWFNLVGMIFAIPIAGILKVFIVRWTKKRQSAKNIVLHNLDDYR